MYRRVFALGCFVLLLFATNVRAEERFRMIEKDDHIVRLDTLTGATSFCKKLGVGLSCSVPAEEREALLAEIDRLETRLKKVENRLAAIEREKPEAPVTQEKEAQNPEQKQDEKSAEEKKSILSDEERKKIDEALNTAAEKAEHVLRSVIDALKGLQENLGQ